MVAMPMPHFEQKIKDGRPNCLPFAKKRQKNRFVAIQLHVAINGSRSHLLTESVEKCHNISISEEEDPRLSVFILCCVKKISI